MGWSLFGRVAGCSIRSRYRVWTIGKLLRVIPLRADQPGQRTPEVFARLEPTNHGLKIMARPPAELFASPRIDIDPIDTRHHRPATTPVLCLVLGNPSPYHCGRRGAKLWQILRPEWRGGADDVASEANS